MLSNIESRTNLLYLLYVNIYKGINYANTLILNVVFDGEQYWVGAEQKNRVPGPRPGTGLDPAGPDPDPVQPGPGPVSKFRIRWQPVPSLVPESLEPVPVPVPGYPV